jgi:hypothetical protein
MAQNGNPSDTRRAPLQEPQKVDTVRPELFTWKPNVESKRAIFFTEYFSFIWGTRTVSQTWTGSLMCSVCRQVTRHQGERKKTIPTVLFIPLVFLPHRTSYIRCEKCGGSSFITDEAKWSFIGSVASFNSSLPPPADKVITHRISELTPPEGWWEEFQKRQGSQAATVDHTTGGRKSLPPLPPQKD